MPASSTRRHRPRRYTARLLLKLDAEAQTTFDTLCTTVHRGPPQVLRQVIDWGLRHGAGWHVDWRHIPHAAQEVTLRLEPEVRTRLHAAARAAGGDASTWICRVLHQIILEDLPAHWQTGEPDPRSHDSRYYDRRYMLRLDVDTSATLEDFSEHFKKPMAEIIRHLVAHATPEDFPPDWHIADRSRPRASTQQRSRP